MDDLTPLVKKAKQGEQAAFEALYEKTSRKIYSYVYYAVQDDALSADIAQETYLRAFKNIRELKDETKFFSWLRTIAVNLTRDYIRIKPDLPSSLEDYTEADKANEPADTKTLPPLEQIEMKELRAEVEQALARLSFEHREVLLLHYYEEFPLEEISSMLDVKTGTLKSRLSRARGRLADILRNKI